MAAVNSWTVAQRWIGTGLAGFLALSMVGATIADPLVIPAARLVGDGVRLQYPRGDVGTRFLQAVGVDLPHVRSLALEMEADSPTQIGVYLIWPDGTTRWRLVVFTPTSMQRRLVLSVDAFDPEPSADWKGIPQGGALLFSYQPAFRKLSPQGVISLRGLQFSSQELPLPPEQDGRTAEEGLAEGEQERFQRILAAWHGKALGGRAGIPREGEAAPAWEALESGKGGDWRELVPEKLFGFGPDDDTTLGVASLFLAESLGRIPAPEDIAVSWLAEVPPEFHWFNSWNALKRFRQGLRPPETGKGELGETLSSRIRIDPWGLVLAGDPQAAGEAAAKDASLNSFGHGIEDARFVGAAIARAFSGGELAQIWQESLEGIEGEYREAALYGWEAHAGGLSLREAYAQARARFFQPLEVAGRERAWVYSVPNAALMSLALAYGEGDPVRILHLAANLGWDSDCNAGTLGTILGAWRGSAAFPAPLVESLGDRLRVGLPGKEHLSLRGLARRTLALSTQLHERSGARIEDSYPEKPENGMKIHGASNFPAVGGSERSTGTELENKSSR